MVGAAVAAGVASCVGVAVGAGEAVGAAVALALGAGVVTAKLGPRVGGVVCPGPIDTHPINRDVTTTEIATALLTARPPPTLR
jgi:hypothetical protein